MTVLFDSPARQPVDCDHALATYEYGYGHMEWSGRPAPPEGTVRACQHCGQLAKGKANTKPRKRKDPLWIRLKVEDA